MLHNGQASGAEQRLHDVLVHACGRAEDTRADVGQVGKLQQALYGSVLAKGAVEHGKDDIDIDRSICGAASQALRSISLKRSKRGMRLWRDDNSLAVREDGCSGSTLGIASSKMPLLGSKASVFGLGFPVEQALSIR